MGNEIEATISHLIKNERASCCTEQIAGIGGWTIASKSVVTPLQVFGVVQVVNSLPRKNNSKEINTRNRIDNRSGNAMLEVRPERFASLSRDGGPIPIELF